MEDKDPFILHIWYHAYWWPGYSRSQGISSHGINPVHPEYSSSSTRILNPSIVKKLPDFSIHNPKNTERYFMRFLLHENGLAPWLCNSRLYHYVGLDLRFSTVKLCKPWLSQPRTVHVLLWGEWEYCYWLWFVFSLQGHIDAWTLYPTFSRHF